MTWTCPLCERNFAHTNQVHSCNDKTIADHLLGKTAYTIDLFNYFIDEYQQLGPIQLFATKSAIAIAANKQFAYVTQLGKNFIHVVLPFDQPYDDNLCFQKIGQVPGTKQFNHHLRIYFKEDLNDEVRLFMKMAYQNGK